MAIILKLIELFCRIRRTLKLLMWLSERYPHWQDEGREWFCRHARRQACRDWSEVLPDLELTVSWHVLEMHIGTHVRFACGIAISDGRYSPMIPLNETKGLPGVTVFNHTWGS